MESEGPYKHSIYGHATGEITKCLACTYAEGRKAERERCAKIAEKEVVLDITSLESGEFYSNSAGRIIAEKIRGGQDGE